MNPALIHVTSLLRRTREKMSTELWPIPALGVVAGLGLGIGLVQLDVVVDPDLPDSVTQYLFGGGPDAARTLLGAIAGSLITVTSLTFSLTVVTLQLASGQFSPRLLRTFARDRFVHLTLALFLGTFTYALAVLRTVRTESGDVLGFVPQLSVTLAFVLCVASVMALVLFLAHLASEIRVETMLRRVHSAASASFRTIVAELELATPASMADVPRNDAMLVAAPGSGFLLHVEAAGLLHVAQSLDCCISIDRRPGEQLIAGSPIGRVWTSSGGPVSPDALEAMLDAVRSAVHIGFERTEASDVSFGLRQLADVVAKALSPGVNDPTTAIHGLGHIAALLRELARHQLGPIMFTGSGKPARVVLERISFADLLEIGLAQARRYGASDPFVMAAMLATLRDIGWHVPTPLHAAAIRAQLERTRAVIDAQDFDPTERTRLAALEDSVEQALLGTWITPD